MYIYIYIYYTHICIITSSSKKSIKCSSVSSIFLFMHWVVGKGAGERRWREEERCERREEWEEKEREERGREREEEWRLERGERKREEMSDVYLNDSSKSPAVFIFEYGNCKTGLGSIDRGRDEHVYWRGRKGDNRETARGERGVRRDRRERRDRGERGESRERWEERREEKIEVREERCTCSLFSYQRQGWIVYLNIHPEGRKEGSIRWEGASSVCNGKEGRKGV